MQLLLHEYRNHNPSIIFLGDISVDIRGNANAACVRQLQRLNYMQCIPNDCITRPTSLSNTLVDHIYTKRNNVGRV